MDIGDFSIFLCKDAEDLEEGTYRWYMAAIARDGTTIFRTPSNEFEIVPLSRMRKLIAENMFQSLRNSAQLM